MSLEDEGRKKPKRDQRQQQVARRQMRREEGVIRMAGETVNMNSDGFLLEGKRFSPRVLAASRWIRLATTTTGREHPEDAPANRIVGELIDHGSENNTHSEVWKSKLAISPSTSLWLHQCGHANTINAFDRDFT